MCEPDGTCDGTAETPYSCVEDCPATDCNNDGTVDALTEQCDDGNDEDGDACTSACTHATCGDGHVYSPENGGTEECDDGNAVAGDGCANDCTIERRNVFITSESYQGNFGGVSEADASCQSLADKVGLAGTYMAWLSDTNSGPSDRFGIDPNFAGVFQLVDGTVLANGWGDLTDGELAATISQNESGGSVLSSSVWTNTDIAGAPKGDLTCKAWTSLSGIDEGHIGLSEFSDSLWTDHKGNGCSNSARLYCFQVQ
jgi:cysteine-rich repeat protein